MPLCPDDPAPPTGLVTSRPIFRRHTKERRVVLRLLGRLPALPEAFVPVIPRWARDTDPQVAALAKRLLERE